MDIVDNYLDNIQLAIMHQAMNVWPADHRTSFGEYGHIPTADTLQKLKNMQHIEYLVMQQHDYGAVLGKSSDDKEYINS